MTDAETATLYREGMTLRQIAARRDVHHTTVRSALLRAGESLRTTSGEERTPDAAPIARAEWRGQVFEAFASGVSEVGDGLIAFVVRVDGAPGPLLFRLPDGWTQRQGSHPLHRANLDVPASLTRELDAWLERGAS